MGSLVATGEATGHLLLLCTPGWGHLRPLCTFAAKAARERPDISITLMAVGGFAKRAEEEIKRYLPDNEANCHARIRVVQIGGEQDSEPFHLFSVIFSAFPKYYEKLVRCEPIQCQSTGTIFPAVPSPTMVILDYFLLPVLETIRARTGTTVPILAWATATVFWTLRNFGPEEIGGLGYIPPKARALAEKTGRNEDDIIEEMYHPTIGTLVKIPGLPPSYDYEWFPQEHDYSVRHGPVRSSGYTFARECDGFVCSSSSAYEPESLNALRKWLADTGNRSLYVVGPLVTPLVENASKEVSSGPKSLELGMSANGSEIQEFLDKVMRIHGKQSLIYISFGTMWWPKNENVLLFIDVLLELRVPFIMSCASLQANIPSDVAQRVNASGIAIISKWTPQQTIFKHPATGWVVTHCGQNTVIEALAEGLPMIAWPIDADQSSNAAHLTLNLDVAFELIEVRTGSGLKPLYRGVQAKGTPEAVVTEAKEVLEKARGEEGARKRRNAEVVRDKLRMGWEEGGEGLENLRQILRVASRGC